MRKQIPLRLFLFLLPYIAVAQEDSILWMTGRHTAAITSIQMSGSLLATSSTDQTVKLWNWQTGKLLHRIDLRAPATAVAFSRDGSMVAAGDTLGGVGVWNTATGKLAARLPGFTDGVVGLSFLADSSDSSGSNRLTAAGRHELVTWEISSATVVRSLPVATPIRSFTASPRLIVLGDETGRIMVVDRRADTIALMDTAHTRAVTSLSLDTADSVLVSGSRDGSIKLWDVRTLEEIRSLVADTTGVIAVELAEDASAFVWSGPRGHLVYQGFSDTTARWQWQTWYTFPSMLMSNDLPGVLAATSQGELVFINADNGNFERWLTSGALISVSYDGSTVAVAQQATNLDVSVANVESFEASSGRLISIIFEIFQAQLTADGRRIVSQSGQKGKLWTFDVQTRELLSTQQVDTGWVLLYGSGPEGEVALSAYRKDSYSSACETDLHYRHYALWDTTTRRYTTSFFSQPNLGPMVLSHDWSMAAALSKYVSCSDGTIIPPLRFWSLFTGSLQWATAEDFKDVAVSARDRLLAVVTGDGNAELVSPTSLQRRPIGRPGHAVAVAFTRDESLVAVSEKEGIISIIDVATGTVLKTLEEYAVDQTSLHFAGDHLVSSAIDGTTIVRRFDPPPVSAAPDEHATARRIRFSVTPNIISDEGTVSIVPIEHGSIRIELVSTTGESVSALYQGEAGPGRLSLGFDTANLPDGLYWCVVTTGIRRNQVPVIVRHAPR